MGNRVTEGCLKCQPLCRKEAVLAGDCYRISVLTPALVRLEYSPEGIFEDRATQVVLNRDFPVPEFQVKETERELVLFTECLELHYDRGPFTAEGLFIRTKGAGSSGAPVRGTAGWTPEIRPGPGTPPWIPAATPRCRDRRPDTSAEPPPARSPSADRVRTEW